MRIKLKIAFIIVLMTFFLFPSWTQETEKKLIEQELNWEDVSGAWGYEVVIRRGTEEIIRDQITESEYSFSLSPGEYEFSVVVLNKFKKAVGMTPWQPLVIREAFQPVVRRFTPGEVFRNQGDTLTIRAEVYQVKPDTAFYLTGEDGNTLEGRQIELNAESVTLEFPLKGLSPGTYTLKAVDSSGLSDISEINTLTVLEVYEPEIRSVSEKRLVQQEVYPKIIVKGKGLKEGFSARIFKDEQIILPYETEWIDEDEIRIALITGDTDPGRYDLEITNPSGIQALKKNVFIIEEAPLTEIVQEVPPEDSFSVLAGYNFAINATAEYGDFGTEPFGLALRIRQDIANRVFWRIPGLRPLGVELDVDVTSLYYENAHYDYDEFYSGIHFYYKVPLLNEWYIMPRLGLGLSNLTVIREGETLQGELAMALTYSLGALKHFQNGILLEFGLDYRQSFYTGGKIGNLHPFVMGGYRF